VVEIDNISNSKQLQAENQNIMKLRERSLFMAGGGTEEKCFSWQKFC
jgi:hypothetical protein